MISNKSENHHIKTIATLEPFVFDILVKTIDRFSAVVEKQIIVIRNSKLITSKNNGTTIHVADLTDFVYPPISLAILIDRDDINRLKEMNGNAEIQIFEDGSYYNFYNGVINVGIAKFNLHIPNFSSPLMDGWDQFGAEVRLADNLESIRRLVPKSGPVDLLFYGDQLKRFATSKTDYINLDPDVESEVVGKSPDIILRSWSFLKLAGSKVIIRIYKKGENYMMVSMTDIGRFGSGLVDNLKNRVASATGNPEKILFLRTFEHLKLRS